MSNIDRAKQFLPFDALKGLREELNRRVYLHNRVERLTLDESQAAEISDVLKRVEKGSVVEVEYYLSGHYITVKAEIKNVDTVNRYLKCEDGKKIYFDDIISINIL